MPQNLPSHGRQQKKNQGWRKKYFVLHLPLPCIKLHILLCLVSFVHCTLHFISSDCFRFDFTRVHFTVSLREHFSLPFIFLHFYCVGCYFIPRRAGSQLMREAWIYVSGTIFAVCWQFSQFVLLLQTLVLFVLATVGLLGSNQNLFHQFICTSCFIL